MRKRLHLQIFGALCLTGAVCALVALSFAKVFGTHAPGAPRFVRDLGAFIVADLPHERGEPYARELERRGKRLHASISLWDADGTLLAQTGRVLPRPQRAQWSAEPFGFEGRSAWIVLDDGRVLALSFDGASRPFAAHRVLFILALVALVLVLGSYVAALRITRRLHALERGVMRFGEGQLATRVPVSGRDEIAGLANAFNRAFERIGGLLTQQRRMLQSASHELRSPLSRLRMALELLAENDVDDATRASLREQAQGDVEELDALIGDLLLAGRLTDPDAPRDFADVAFDGVVAEECARVGARFRGERVTVHGNGRMLRSLVRNLLENARRYGRPELVAELRVADGVVTLCVDDAGDGVPAVDQERIFEPFFRRNQHHEGKEGGVGLGLSLVRSIAEHHAGSVRYVPLAPGSRFEVKLPLEARRS